MHCRADSWKSMSLWRPRQDASLPRRRGSRPRIWFPVECTAIPAGTLAGERFRRYFARSCGGIRTSLSLGTTQRRHDGFPYAACRPWRSIMGESYGTRGNRSAARYSVVRLARSCCRAHFGRRNWPGFIGRYLNALSTPTNLRIGCKAGVLSGRRDAWPESRPRGTSNGIPRCIENWGEPVSIAWTSDNWVKPTAQSPLDWMMCAVILRGDLFHHDKMLSDVNNPAL